MTGGSKDPSHAVDRRPRLVAIVRPDHPPASRQRQRLDHARKAHRAHRGGEVIARGEEQKAGLGDVRNLKRLAHRRLVARVGDGGGRIVGQPQALGGERRRHHPLVIDADDRRKRCVASAREDRLGGVGRV